jgi:hypothetical protein
MSLKNIVSQILKQKASRTKLTTSAKEKISSLGTLKTD